MRRYNNPLVDKAHDVRAMCICALCRGLGSTHSMLCVPLKSDEARSYAHGRCFIEKFGLAKFVKLPRRETKKMMLSDIGLRAMKALLAAL